MRRSEDERLLLEALRERGFELSSIVEWLVRGSRSYAGAEELLARHLEACRDEKLVGILARLLERRAWRPALPALIAKVGQVRGRTAEYRVAQAIAKLGVEGHEESALAALQEARTIAAQRLLTRALRKAGVEPPQTAALASEARAVAVGLAALLAIVGGLTLGLSPLIVGRAGRLVLLPLVLAGVASIALAVAVWQRSRRMASLYLPWAVAIVLFHATYQAGAHLFSWTGFLLLELAGVVVLWSIWRFLILGLLS